MAKINYKAITLTLGLIAFSFLFVWYVFAQWQEPTTAPPGDNVPAPINVGSVAQNKLGDFGIGGDVGQPVYWLSNVGGTLQFNNAVPETKLVIGQDGNVGIGTTIPLTKLDVAGSFAVADRVVIGHDDPNNYWRSDAIAGFNPNIPTHDAFMFVPGFTDAQTSDLRLYIVDDADDRFSIWGNTCGGGNCGDLNAASNLMTVLGSGNIGIGTTSPAEKLFVQGNNPKIVVRDSSDGNDYNSAWGEWITMGSPELATFNVIGTEMWKDSDYAFFGLRGTGNASAAVIQWGDDGTEVLRFLSGSPTSPTEWMRIQADGRLRLYGADAGMWIEAGTNDWFIGRTGSDLRFYSAGDRMKLDPYANLSLTGRGYLDPNPRLELELNQTNVSGTSSWIDIEFKHGGIRKGLIRSEGKAGAGGGENNGLYIYAVDGNSFYPGIKLCRDCASISANKRYAVGLFSTNTGGNYLMYVYNVTHNHEEFVVRGNGTIWSRGFHDIAETIAVSDLSISGGDVIKVGKEKAVPGARVYAEKTTKPYEQSILGVISDEPGYLLAAEGGHTEDAKHPEKLRNLALAGRVLVKVNLEGGAIEPGDYLTSSSVPGVAMRANKAGFVVGMALEEFESSEQGTILVFINPGWVGSILNQ